MTTTSTTIEIDARRYEDHDDCLSDGGALMSAAIRAEWTHRMAAMSPPRRPREWSINLPLPEGQPCGDHADHDAVAAEVAPHGWYCVGTIPVSSRSATCAPTWTGWSVRVTYWPEVWRSSVTMQAPPAVYAAAQIAGLPTRLDATITADHSGIQYSTPDGHPLSRQCWWEGREELPAAVTDALDEIERIDRRRTVGYMWARPDTGRAAIVAADEARSDTVSRRAASGVIAEWVRSSWPSVCAEI